MIFKITILAVFTLGLLSCKNKNTNFDKPRFERLLQDTTNNRRAKQDLHYVEHYNSICKLIGINKLSDGVDSFEVRVWRQFSVFGQEDDEEIYSLKIVDSTVYLTFYRVYWIPENHVDSFFAVSKSFPIKIVDSMNLQNLWNLKTLSALNIPDSIGFLDGTTTSIELASKSKYKLIRYHVAEGYYEATKINDIKDYMDDRNKLIDLFQSNKIYNQEYY